MRDENTPFIVGDMVERVGGYCHGLVQGEIRRVTRVRCTGHVELDGHGSYAFHKRKFVLASRHSEESMVEVF